METWKTPGTALTKRILLLVRDKYAGECPLSSAAIAAELGANSRTVSTSISRMLKEKILIRTEYGLKTPK